MKRRTLLAAAAALPFSPARAATLRPRPGQPPVTWQSRMVTDLTDGPVFQLDFEGLGSVRLPTRYSRALVLGMAMAARREVLLVRFEGNGGTGVSQMLVGVVGCDNEGRLRILGIETVSVRDHQSNSRNRETEGRLAGNARGFELRVSMRGQGVPDRRWNTLLPWNGDGVIIAPATPPGSPPERVVMDEARREVAAYLAAEPRTSLVGVPMGDWKLFRVGLLG